MKRFIFLFIFLIPLIRSANSQCTYIAATSTITTDLTYSFSGGMFQSFYNCFPIFVNYWLTGNRNTITINFNSPQSNPSLRVWGINDDDTAEIFVNGAFYNLNSTTANYDTKVLCGGSPGPNGIIFSNGKLTGANNNVQSNYSYQNLTLLASNINTITITGKSGAGWGFDGISIRCFTTSINEYELERTSINIYPNPTFDYCKVFLGFQASEGKVSIYDSKGCVVYSRCNISSDEFDINLRSFAAGVYFLQFSDVLTNKKTKFIIQPH